ncbi:HAD hydrolase family protein [Candidatus Woesearchaeota archaeon]|uniref:3-deoxy-D-manno-octulosonate 8-phosphate phosphatase n=2 Tax=Parcubacteria group TaxID=1794811 RepID=A0A1F8HS96_9BACT|nr:MAG: HAD-superfamily hydrolase, subfamily IIIA [Candidatus Jorgensenbacteria bacterium GW2011_GWF2_41_8]MBS3161922.1 HAD hydrolase family protein [Candidatus Woesearchaeota archaeon]OGN40454.1 MAG: hypothetical protein A2606_01675 [Candidatus Yanofskybacteria bacterium RIFOXYD1_FULL_42_10]
MNHELMEKFKKVKILALDCDGVMAPLYIDTGVIMDVENAMKFYNREYKYVVEISRFNHRDGQGIDLMRAANIPVVVITRQRSGYIDARCFKLGIPCVKVEDKLEGLKNWLKNTHPKVSLSEVCYMGDDISDIHVLQVVGAPVTVADAISEAKAIAVHITQNKGGDGAIREVCSLILNARCLK